MAGLTARGVVLLGLLAASACAPPPAASGPSSTVRSPAPSRSEPADLCADLRARAPGIEACPPTDLALDRPSVGHDPGIADDDARHMAEGLARSWALANWAINQGYGGFLRAGLVASGEAQATAVSFGDDLRYLDDARRAGTRYRIDTPLVLSRVVAVPVPQPVADQARRGGLVPGPVGLSLVARGAVRRPRGRPAGPVGAGHVRGGDDRLRRAAGRSRAGGLDVGLGRLRGLRPALGAEPVPCVGASPS